LQPVPHVSITNVTDSVANRVQPKITLVVDEMMTKASKRSVAELWTFTRFIYSKKFFWTTLFKKRGYILEGYF
jgi:hypothetical protein